MTGRSRIRLGLDLLTVAAGGLVAAHGAYLLAIGPLLRVETSNGIALSMPVPTTDGLLPLAAGVLVLAGVTVRREVLVWLGVVSAAVFVAARVSTVGPPVAPIAAVLLVLAAARVADPASRRAALAVVLGLLGVVAVLLLALTVRRPVLYPIGYQVADDRTLKIVVATGDPIPCDIGHVEESATDVRVFAECLEPFLSTGSLAMLIEHTFDVTLQRPLGTREVVDGNGRPGTLCPTFPCS
jgi:hypothetical protein